MTEEYLQLVEKFQLPKLEDFEKDFGFIESPTDSPLLVELRRKMVEKVDYFANLISDLIQPDTNISNIYEYKNFSDNQRQILFNIFRILMSYSRKSSSLTTFYDERAEVEFVQSFFNEWQDLKITIKRELDFISNTWKNESVQEDIFENYMG